MLILYYKMRWTWLPTGGWYVKKIMTNHVPHATYIPLWKWIKKLWKEYKVFIVGILLIGLLILVCQIKDCKNKSEKFDTYTPSEKVEEKDTSAKVGDKPKPETKKPWFGFGKGTTPKIIIEDTTPKKKSEPSTKVEILGEESEVRVRKGSPVKVTIVREPLIKLIPYHPFAIGVMATYDLEKLDWGFYAKLQPLEIGKFGVSVWGGNKGYGLGVGYLHKGWSLDVLYNWHTKLIGMGASRKL